MFISCEICDLDSDDVASGIEQRPSSAFTHRGDTVLERFDGGEVFRDEVGMDDDLET